jgi:hypothetical protein
VGERFVASQGEFLTLPEAAEPLLALASLWAMYRVHKDFAGRMGRSENRRTLGGMDAVLNRRG